MRKTLSAISDPVIRKSLGYSVMDGVMWSLMFGFAENYVTPFVLLFGASVFEVSLLQGLTQLSIGTGQLAGGTLILKVSSRKKMLMATVAVQASSWILTFFGTLVTGSPLVGILLYCFGVLVANLSSPGWLSWMNDLVPPGLRGAYWSKRNLISGVAQFGAISIAGLCLYQAHLLRLDKTVYGGLFALAFFFRMGSTFFLKRSYDPPMPRGEAVRSLSFLKFLKEIPGTNFGGFVLFIILINLTISMVNPIIQVYLIEKLKFNYIQYTVVTMTATIANFVFMTYWGPLSDRFGNRRILVVAATLLPFVAVGWLFLTDVWTLVLLQLLSGFLTSALGLSTNNYIFDAIPSERISKIMAYFNTLNTFFAFLGALFSGILAQVIVMTGWHLGFLDSFLTVFLVAAVLRGAIVLFFAKRFQEVRPTEPSPGLRYFYVYRPMQGAVAFLSMTGGRLFRGVQRLDPRNLRNRWLLARAKRRRRLRK